MISNSKERECVICDSKTLGKEPLYSGIIFNNLQGDPYICERCVFMAMTQILGRTSPKSKFDKHMNWKPEIGLKKSMYTVVQEELGYEDIPKA